jgi:hypothetical protein
VNSSVISANLSPLSERLYNNLIKLPYKRCSTTLHNKSDLNPLFVTGLIDAEGCFHLGLTINDKYKLNYQVALMFTMSLHEKDKDFLILLKFFFGVGNITKHGSSTLQYRIRTIKDLFILISPGLWLFIYLAKRQVVISH